jgi:hypothetical protein
MTKGRVYALTGGDDLIKIVYFDKENKHVKEINFGHKHAGLDPPMYITDIFIMRMMAKKALLD